MSGSYRDAMRAVDDENKRPETRHSHGTIRHDHEGGDVPHDHAVGRGSLGRYTDQDGAQPRPSGHGGSAAFGFGTVFIVLGALAMLFSENNHSACTSPLVQVLSQSGCSAASTIWTLGILGLVVGAVLLIVGAILRRA